MTHTQMPEVAAKGGTYLDERENQRAVDLIENAERSAPYCMCGAHMLAVSHGEEIWLECSRSGSSTSGWTGMLSRLANLGHSRRLIMAIPAE